MIGFDYSKLRGKIKEVFNTQAAFAKEMGMSKTSLSEKLNNKVEFTQKEIKKAIELLHIPKEEIPMYFFTVENEINARMDVSDE
jgi:transcriptional regulator with XRE-family HTH domain